MGTTLVDLKEQRECTLAKADGIISAAERSKRKLTADESRTVDSCIAEVRDLDAKIAQNQSTTDRLATLRALRAENPELNYPVSTGKEATQVPLMPTRLSADYQHSFHTDVMHGRISATSEEGSDTLGGYAVPVVVEQQIVALAPQDFAIRRLATVIPTKSDIKVPRKTAIETASAKAEGAAFTPVSPAIAQFTLSAFGIGTEVQASFEIAQDVVLFDAFVSEDMALGVQEAEEASYLSGSGSGEPQGLIGNVGSGVTEEPDGLGNLVTIDGTLNLIETLKATYHRNASWLMQRTTSILLRKAQAQTNYYAPIFTRENGQDYLHGYPVEYSASMPSAARGNAPILFGDFARGYIVGDRGGPAIRVKVLDQALAAQGLVVFLAFRRTDGRIRQAEAIQQYNIAAS